MKNFIKVLIVVCFCAAALFVYADGGLNEPCIDGYLCEDGLTCHEGVCIEIGICANISFYASSGYTLDPDTKKICRVDGIPCGIEERCGRDPNSTDSCQSTICANYCD